MSNLSSATRRESGWIRFWRFVRQFEEAMDMSEVEILQRRLSRLEREVADLKSDKIGHFGARNKSPPRA
jgi:hypothetical protein